MSKTSRGIKQRSLAGAAVAVMGLASMMFGFAVAPVSADEDNGVTCKKIGYPDNVSSASGEWGSASYSGTVLTVDVNAGYVVTVCVKGGSEDSITEQTFSADGSYTHPQNISHIGVKFNGDTPSTEPTDPTTDPTDPTTDPTDPTTDPTDPTTDPTDPTTIETLPTESTAPTDPTTIETLPTEGTDPGDPNNPGNPGNPGQPEGDEPEVLGIAKNAPAAAPTAVAAGLGGEESSSNSTLWILAGGALALAGLALGFAPVTARGKRAL